MVIVKGWGIEAGARFKGQVKGKSKREKFVKPSRQSLRTARRFSSC